MCFLLTYKSVQQLQDLHHEFMTINGKVITYDQLIHFNEKTDKSLNLMLETQRSIDNNS